jgi:hypothetical protein
VGSVFSQPGKVEQVDTPVNGNSHCTLTITLPLGLAGIYLPKG